MLPLAVDDDLYLVVAPRGAAARQILRLIEENPARARRFRFTSAERLNRFVLRYAGKTLAAAPYAWEKTEHGLAKSSRRAATMTRSLVELERYLSALKESGELPTLVPDVSQGAAQRRRSRVAA
jgi:hypothetical protein